MIYPLILSGGIGKRLWPLSSKKNPKQFQKLLNDKTLIQNTYDRILKGFAKENIFVVTGASMADDTKAQINIEDRQIFREPIGKGTAMAIGYAAMKLKNIDEEAIIATVNSDHYIKEEEKYLDIIKEAGQIIEAQSDQMLLIGIKPQYPETGFGYIELGEEVKKNIHKVQSFKEKPGISTAKQFIESGNYLWNAAYFVFKAKELLKWYKEYLPEHYQALLNIEKDESLIEAEYAKVDKVSIDVGLLEKMPNKLVMPAELTWADIGHWKSLKDVLSDGNNNVSNTKQLVTLDSKNNLLYSFNDKKLIATVGVEDMILVETEDAILLCPANRAQDVKELLKEIKKENLDKYL
ncbi:MAG: mannose-1-phosphate guanylyltransferase [Candidatus Komeilibacteria bacterium]|jgi:mannose-1-phosphate guanylyltransferase|nr:mannose-1-phosphate guanylyltransferase [Candidatus Komeilibacteria bacterium]MBT4447850.1 mannose-1-phosphate guanylyltransferase [Candidatus Komeilibacteria bacterium]